MWLQVLCFDGGTERPAVTRSPRTQPSHVKAVHPNSERRGMPSQDSRLGVCPRCGESIYQWHVLVEYESGNDPRYWAECPDCGEVVDPRR